MYCTISLECGYCGLEIISKTYLREGLSEVIKHSCCVPDGELKEREV